MKQFGHNKFMIQFLFGLVSVFSFGIYYILNSQTVADGFRTTIGLCDVGEFENLPPGTAAQLKY
jgi:drug/metabolite transporter (DMT)-like permease